MTSLRREHRFRAKLVFLVTRTGGPAILEALVQHVEITPDADTVLAAKAEESGVRLSDLREVPFMLVGTPDEIMAAVRRNRQRWGITRYAVRRNALDSLAPLLPRLAQL